MNPETPVLEYATPRHQSRWPAVRRALRVTAWLIVGALVGTGAALLVSPKPLHHARIFVIHQIPVGGGWRNTPEHAALVRKILADKQATPAMLNDPAVIPEALAQWRATFGSEPPLTADDVRRRLAVEDYPRTEVVGLIATNRDPDLAEKVARVVGEAGLARLKAAGMEQVMLLNDTALPPTSFYRRYATWGSVAGLVATAAVLVWSWRQKRVRSNRQRRDREYAF